MKYLLVLFTCVECLACRVVCSNKGTVILCNPEPGRVYSIIKNSATIVPDMRCRFGKDAWLSYCETPKGAPKPALVTTEYESVTRLAPKDEQTIEESWLVFKIKFKNTDDSKLSFEARFKRDSDDCSIDPKG